MIALSLRFFKERALGMLEASNPHTWFDQIRNEKVRIAPTTHTLDLDEHKQRTHSI